MGKHRDAVTRWTRRLAMVVGFAWLSTMPAQAGHLSVNASDIQTDAVTARTIRDAAVSRTKLRNLAVTTSKLRDRAVSTDKLRLGSVTTDRLADGAVTSEKIDDGAVSTDDLADQAVTVDKIATPLMRAYHAAPNSGPNDIAASPSSSLVVDIDIPSGAYLVIGHVTVKNQDGSDSASARCTLEVSDSSLIGGAIELDSYPLSLGPGESKAFPLQAVRNVGGNASLFLIFCNKGGSDSAQLDVTEDPKLAAVRLLSIVAA